VSHDLRSLLGESVPYVKIYRYNPKHLYPKSSGYIYEYITRLASKEIFSPSNKIYREVGRAKDLSAIIQNLRMLNIRGPTILVFGLLMAFVYLLKS
jgi:hypothetical protein